MSKITKRTVDALDATDGRDVILWDTELKGFGVRANAGGAKTYLVQYRNQEGRTRKLALGRHGPLTPEQARRLAKERLGAVAKGEDPAEERKTLRAGLKVSEVCDWFLENARSGRILGRRRRPIASKTLDMDESRIDRHIKPLLGTRAVQNLTLWDIEGMQSAIVSGRTSKPRNGRGGVTTGGPGVASRTVGTLRLILGHAMRAGIIDKNPATGVRLVASTPKSRALSFAEIRRIGAALAELRAEGEHPIGLAAIHLALLTGFRRMEILGLQRSWVYGPEGYVRFPHTKTGPQIRPLGPSAAALVHGQPQRIGSPWVFPADVGEGHFIGLPRVFQRVCERAEVNNATLHTLRHTFASIAGHLNFSEITIAGLLGHAARGVTQGYVHLDQALVLAAGRVSDEIGELLGVKPAPACASTQPSEEELLAEHLISMVS